MLKIYESAAEAAEYLNREADGGEGWCVGTTSDPKRRLAAVHLVDLVKDEYRWVKCTSESVARETENIMYETYGFRPVHNAPTMMDDDVFVYVYRMTADTSQGE